MRILPLAVLLLAAAPAAAADFKCGRPAHFFYNDTGMFEYMKPGVSSVPPPNLNFINVKFPDPAAMTLDSMFMSGSNDVTCSYVDKAKVTIELRFTAFKKCTRSAKGWTQKGSRVVADLKVATLDCE